MSWAKVKTELAKVITFGRKIEPAVEAAAEVTAQVTGNPAANTVAVDLSLLNGLATTVGAQLEAVKGTGATDAETAEAMAPLVLRAIENSGFLDGKQIADTSKYNAAVQTLSEAFLGVTATLEPAPAKA
jgi:hypothetical protein